MSAKNVLKMANRNSANKRDILGDLLSLSSNKTVNLNEMAHGQGKRKMASIDGQKENPKRIKMSQHMTAKEVKIPLLRTPDEEARKIEKLRREARIKRSKEVHYDAAEQQQIMMNYEWTVQMEEQEKLRKKVEKKH
ncbi:Upf2 domain-containing protein [Caenorhabditis elegans]|uniref:Upf2 domain-containing protein n=1 Tax=Caenorhabditis elegans TaxID=6239 RepID=Q17714_CAEEL|nr:Upf2 domain-containing protein [Caenorhabditis elegans]CAA85314.1 Upf2 domain-containing protein [Caenorhabditis elegans]|eukprot:NP_496000.1 Uncharacterized protein CELE_C06C3.7 [Caenorhabditis elegans]